MKNVGYLQDMTAMVTMERSEFEKTLSVEGNMVFQELKKLADKRDHMELIETKNGFHLCFKDEKENSVKFIQIWGSPLERLETRFNYIERKVNLPNEAKDRIRNILMTGGFEKMESSPYGNMRLKFRELPRPLGSERLNAVMDAIVSSISLLKECRPLR